jgi:hypothetical protein
MEVRAEIRLKSQLVHTMLCNIRLWYNLKVNYLILLKTKDKNATLFGFYITVFL